MADRRLPSATLRAGNVDVLDLTVPIDQKYCSSPIFRMHCRPRRNSIPSWRSSPSTQSAVGRELRRNAVNPMQFPRVKGAEGR